MPRAYEVLGNLEKRKDKRYLLYGHYLNFNFNHNKTVECLIDWIDRTLKVEINFMVKIERNYLINC